MRVCILNPQCKRYRPMARPGPERRKTLPPDQSQGRGYYYWGLGGGEFENWNIGQRTKSRWFAFSFAFVDGTR